MPKKKISNRLDKLFDEINKETQTQETGPAKSGEKPTKPTATALSVSSVSESKDSRSEMEIPESTKDSPTLSDANMPISTMLSTAFRTDEKNWATLKIVDETEQRFWGTEEQMLVKQVADQLSLALENARLFQEAQRRAKEMTALAEIGREISATLELQAVLERIAIRAQEILNTITTAVYVPDPTFQTLMAITAIGVEADEVKNDPLKIGRGILGYIAQTKVGEIVNYVMQDSRAVTIQGTEDASEEHLMAAPIVTQNVLNGLLVVWRVGSGEEFTQTEFEFLRSLAQQAAIAVENARLFEETQARAEELAVLNEMGRELSAEMNVTHLSETAYQYTSKLLDTTNFFIALYDEKKNLLTFPLTINDGHRIDNPPRPLGNGLTDYIIQSKEPLFMPNNIPARMEEIGLKFIPLGNDKPALSWLGVPLLIGNEVKGVIALQSVEKALEFDENDKELLTTIANQLAISFENARLFNEAQSRARREKILREITAHIRATNDPEMIAKAAVRELGQALGVSTFIRLGASEVSSKQEEVEPGKPKKKIKKSGPAKKSKKAAEGGI